MEEKITAYCLYLILKDAQPAIENITEDWIMQNIAGADLAMFDVIEQLGFLNGQKVETLRKRNAPVQNQTKTEEKTGQ